MPRTDPRTIATAASRSAGGKARAAKLQQRRLDVEHELEQHLLDAGSEALARLRRSTADDADPAGVRAAVHLLERVLGKPVQKTQLTGSIDVNVDARARLADLLAHRSDPRRKKGDSR